MISPASNPPGCTPEILTTIPDCDLDCFGVKKHSSQMNDLTYKM